MVNDYDLNLYGWDKKILSLSAYQQGFNQFDEVVTNTSPNTTFTRLFTYPGNREEIAWLLQVVPERLDVLMEEWGEDGLTDYDEWPGFNDIVGSNSCPVSILEWLGNLPAYERKQLD